MEREAQDNTSARRVNVHLCSAEQSQCAAYSQLRRVVPGQLAGAPARLARIPFLLSRRVSNLQPIGPHKADTRGCL